MMTLFLTYELKVAVLIAVFYIFWRLLVANETWHRLNRIVLLSTAVASFVLPLCVITIHQTIEVAPAATDTMTTALPMDDLPILSEASSVTVAPETEKPFNWQLPLTFIYIIGVVVVLSKMLLSLWRLHKMKAESEIHPLADGRQIAVCDKAKTPFSWWKTVFLNHQDFEEGTTALLTHELGHLRLHHSADVLLVELLTALQWFNPAMWMLRADLRTIHEYEADQQVISHGFNDIQYLQLLIRKAAGQSGYSLANGISNSALKKRVTMIMKPKSNRNSILKLLALVPIVGLALVVNAEKVQDVIYTDAEETSSIIEEKMVAEAQPEAMNVEESSTISFRVVFWPENAPVEGVPVEVINHGTTIMKAETANKGEVSVNAPVGSTVRFTLIDKVKDVKITKELVAKGGVHTVAFGDGSENFEDKPVTVQGIVYDDSSTPIVGALVQIVGSKKGTVTDFDGKFKLDTSTGDALLFSYVGYDSEQIGVAKLTADKKDCIVRLKKTDTGKVYDVVDEMPQFPGGPGALFEYIGKSLKYPAEAEKAGTQGRVIATFVVEKDGSITNAKVVKAIDPLLDAEALRIIHEMPKWNPGKQDGELMRVKYTIPISFRLQGNNDDARQYSGTVKIDKTKRVHQSVETVVVGDEAEKEPYVVVDGKPIDGAKLKEIDPKTIEHMEVLKSKVAIEKYGEKGKDGVIIITIKKK